MNHPNVTRDYLLGSPALDPVFVGLRQDIFGRSRNWIEIVPPHDRGRGTRALFDLDTQKMAGIRSAVLGPALGWETRPWTQSSNDAPAIPALVEALNQRSDWDVCQINALSSEEAADIRLEVAKHGNGVIEHWFPLAVITGVASYADYLKRRSPSTNKNQRRALRQATVAGLEFREKLSWESIEAVLDARSREFGNGDDYTKTPEFRAFLKKFRSQMIEAGRWTEVGLFHGDKPVSYDLGFWSGRVFHSYQTAFDPAYKEYRPGAITFEKSLELVLTRGCDLVDMMGASEYMKFFTKEILELKRVTVSSRSLKGRLLSLMFSFKSRRSNKGNV